MAGLMIWNLTVNDISSLHALKIVANYLKASPQMGFTIIFLYHVAFLKPDQQVTVYRYYFSTAVCEIK